MRVQKFRQQRPFDLRRAIDDQIFPEVFRIVEGKMLCAVFDEEVEWVVDGHVGDEVDLDPEFAHRFGEHEPRHPVAVWVLLVINEMPFRRDLQAVRDHMRPAVRRGP